MQGATVSAAPISALLCGPQSCVCPVCNHSKECNISGLCYTAMPGISCCHLILQTGVESRKRGHTCKGHHVTCFFKCAAPLLQDEELIIFFNENCTKLGIHDPVDAVRVVRDSASQLGKGFGFVQFSDQAAARAAMGCDGQLLRKRPIRVTKAVKVPAHLKDLGKAPPGKKLISRDASERKSPAGSISIH